MTYNEKGKKTGVKYVGGYVVEPKQGDTWAPCHMML